MSDVTYVKLSQLVNDEFTVESMGSPKWRAWDEINRKFETSDFYAPNHQKIYPTVTDKGKLDLSASQVGQMLEGVVYDGKADVVGITFRVKSNGKVGKEIRYWLNPTESTRKPAKPAENAPEDEFKPEDEPSWQ